MRPVYKPNFDLGHKTLFYDMPCVQLDAWLLVKKSFIICLVYKATIQVQPRHPSFIIYLVQWSRFEIGTEKYICDILCVQVDLHFLPSDNIYLCLVYRSKFDHWTRNIVISLKESSSLNYQSRNNSFIICLVYRSILD